MLATIYEALFMIFGLILSAIMAIGLLVYLVIATLPPERF
jgi:K+-transporting ATPase KdpF subunit